MDYATNKKFFDKKHNKKVKILMNIGTPFTVLGAAMLALSSIPGLGLRFFMMLCWYPLIVGVPILAVAFSLRVKESDMLDLIDTEKRAFKQLCEEKLDYPGDIATNGILLSGCAEQDDPVSPPRKLKSGAMLYPVVTLTYLYIKKDRVTAMTRQFSLCEEMSKDQDSEIRFSELDDAKVVPAGSENNQAHAMQILENGTPVFTAPLFANDYNVEQFAENILHNKERRR